MSIFCITSDNERIRLKSYDATIKEGVTTLRLTVQITDSYELSYILDSLADLKKAHATVRKPARAEPKKANGRKRLGHQPMLMLPPPDRGDAE